MCLTRASSPFPSGSVSSAQKGGSRQWAFTPGLGWHGRDRGEHSLIHRGCLCLMMPADLVVNDDVFYLFLQSMYPNAYMLVSKCIIHACMVSRISSIACFEYTSSSSSSSSSLCSFFPPASKREHILPKENTFYQKRTNSIAPAPTPLSTLSSPPLAPDHHQQQPLSSSVFASLLFGGFMFS